MRNDNATNTDEPPERILARRRPSLDILADVMLHPAFPADRDEPWQQFSRCSDSAMRRLSVTSGTGRSPIRIAACVALLHTILVVAVIVGKYLLWAESGRWPGERFLRFIDFPVLWLVDSAMQSFSLPAEWFYPRLFVALAVHESIAYAVIGGAFYAAIAATIVFARKRIKPPAGTPVIGPRPVDGGTGKQVISPKGVPPRSVTPKPDPLTLTKDPRKEPPQ